MREGAQYLVHSPKNEDIVIALREIAASKIRIERNEPSPPDEEQT
jgi:DNA-directed RNA polymerase subunit omega